MDTYPTDYDDSALGDVLEERETVLCYECRGSGEGMHDGTKCRYCGGSGEVRERSAYDDAMGDIEYDRWRDAKDERERERERA
jgi:hypothetical protein